MYSNKNIGRTVSSGGGGGSFEEIGDAFSGNKTEAGHKHKTKHNTACRDNDGKLYGLSTKVALGRLHDEIDKMLKVYELKWKEERYDFGCKLLENLFNMLFFVLFKVAIARYVLHLLNVMTVH